MQPSTDAAVFPSYLRPYPHCGAYANGYPLGPQFYHSAVSLQYPLPQSVAASSSYHTPSGSSSPSDHSDEDCGSLGDNPAVQRTLFRPIDFDNCDTGGSSGPSPLPPASAYFPPTPSSSSSQNSEADERSCSGRSSSSSAHGVTASVLDKEMWDSFNSVGNEMIVTKPGRRLFPALLVSLRGLQPTLNYTVFLRIHTADAFRYKFLNSRWSAIGESEIMQNEARQTFRHPNSPHSGEFWMKKPISFKTVKITHNLASKNGNVLLHTMHKYVMQLVLEVEGQEPVVIPLPETTFIAVTSYQNSMLTQLKIDNNPFAKGFRDRDDATFCYTQPYSLPPPVFARSLWEAPPLSTQSPASPAHSTVVGSPAHQPAYPYPLPWAWPYPVAAGHSSPSPPASSSSTAAYSADDSGLLED